MKIAVPDVVSNSYFPALAADRLGFFRAEGIDLSVEHVYPVADTFAALRDGKVEFVAGSAHGIAVAFPEWCGAKLVASLSHGMYWFLVMRADLGAKRGDCGIVKGRLIGAAPVVDNGLKRLLAEAGIDIEKDEVVIAPVPGTTLPGVSFGIAAARALEEKKIDGFWANGVAAELAVRSGAGTIVLDVRRGDGPPSAFHYTRPCLSTTVRMIDGHPEIVAAAVRAIVAAQRALKQDIGLATQVVTELPADSDPHLIADVVARDLPYYDPSISEDFVRHMTRFARDVGLLRRSVTYEEAVATEFRHLWQGP